MGEYAAIKTHHVVGYAPYANFDLDQNVLRFWNTLVKTVDVLVYNALFMKNMHARAVNYRADNHYEDAAVITNSQYLDVLFSKNGRDLLKQVLLYYLKG